MAKSTFKAQVRIELIRNTFLKGILVSGLVLASLGEDSLLAEEAVTPVEVVPVQKSSDAVQELSLTGTVTSQRRSQLSSRASGLVRELHVDAGSQVAEGEVLMDLDNRLAEIALEQIQAEMARAQIELDDARNQVEEVRNLTQIGGFPKSEQERRKTAALVAEANLQQLEVREREQAEIIDRHHLMAPFEGVINQKMTEAGEWVVTGTPVLELVETSNLRFDIQVPQEYYTLVQRAGKVLVRLDAWPDRELRGEIDVAVPVQDPVSRTFLTRVRLEDSEGLAAPGMSGTAVISASLADDTAMRVPRDAVVRFPDGTARVWVVQGAAGDAVALSREVRTAGSLGNFSRIIEGLEGGEQVVLKGNENLREGQRVEVLPALETPERR